MKTTAKAKTKASAGPGKLRPPDGSKTAKRTPRPYDPRSKRMNAQKYSLIIATLVAEGGSIRSLSQVTGMSEVNMRIHVFSLRDRGALGQPKGFNALVHIDHWEQRTGGGECRAFYKFGPGNDKDKSPSRRTLLNRVRKLRKHDDLRVLHALAGTNLKELGGGNPANTSEKPAEGAAGVVQSGGAGYGAV